MLDTACARARSGSTLIQSPLPSASATSPLHYRVLSLITTLNADEKASIRVAGFKRLFQPASSAGFWSLKSSSALGDGSFQYDFREESVPTNDPYAACNSTLGIRILVFSPGVHWIKPMRYPASPGYFIYVHTYAVHNNSQSSSC